MTTPHDARAFADDGHEASVVDGESLRGRPVTDDVDFVVVGSGASGAVAAHTLASHGYSVAIVEEGPWIRTRDTSPSVDGIFSAAIRDRGMQVAQGRAFIPILQGSAVGGSTFVNSAIAWRIPGDVLVEWKERFGVDLPERDLEPHFDALERDLSVRSVAPDVLGENSRLFLEQCKKRGYDAAPMRRYDAGCEGSARCLQGCPNARKQSMSVTYVPWALRLGARIYTSCKVSHVEVRGSRAVGVVGRAKGGASVHLRARLGVLVAASTIQTPNLLRRSGVRAKALGKHFQVHPGVGMGALFDRTVHMTFGATQGAESTHFRATDRFKLETIGMPPELAAARLPGVGHDLLSRMAHLDDVGVWVAQLRARAEGEISRDVFGNDVIRYSPTEDDMRIARKALATIAELFFDAGAREVWPGVFGLPTVLRSPDEIRLLREGPLDPRAYGLVSSHLFGAARMGPNAGTSVVDPSFAVHGTDRLWVVDSSVFPTNLGVNPQHSIMALARYASTAIASGSRRVAAA
ncbi:MAG: GMC family oxidoreductase [Myxococcales bacterium]|nr:GMC family oxidoreductase [Myxococcales bacterium]